MRLPALVVLPAIPRSASGDARRFPLLRRSLTASLSLGLLGRYPRFNSLKKSLPLSSIDDEGREIHHLDAPDRFHAQLGILSTTSTFLMQCSARLAAAPADQAEIEAAVLLAGLAHRDRAVALGEHHHSSRQPPGTESTKGIHAPRRGRTERAGSVTFRRFRGARVIDRVVLEVVRQRLASLSSRSRNLACAESARRSLVPVSDSRVSDRVFREQSPGCPSSADWRSDL